MTPSHSTPIRFSLVTAAMSLSIGCVTPALAKGEKSRRNAEQPAEAPMTGTPHVAGNWQKKLVDQLEADKLDEGWGLFSEGGWSDAGQVMLLTDKNKTKFTLLIVKPNDREKSGSRPFTQDQWKALAPVVDKVAGLADVEEQMFDGLIFEIVHLKREGSGKLKEAKRVYYKATGRIPHPDHEAVIKAFQDLKGDAT